MSLKCAYHPDREAITKCEKCGKLICVECKTVVHDTHIGKDSSYSTRHEICVACKYDREISHFGFGFSVIPFLMIIAFLLIFIGITTYANINMPHFNLIALPIIGTIALVIISAYFIYWMTVKRKRGILKAKIEKEEYLKKLIQLPSKKDDTPSKMFCPECGGEISSDDIICSHCGSTIKDESQIG
ncbi:MAG: B-box zinc finger protein [Promethearchaeota archaeon]